MRTWSMFFGVGLLVLWLAGLNNPQAVGWLTWLDGLAGILAFAVSAGLGDFPSRRAAMRGPIALSIGLFAMWAVALTGGVPAWQGWWTFAFACGFLFLGVAGGRRPGAVRPTEIHTVEERERFRKGA